MGNRALYSIVVLTSLCLLAFISLAQPGSQLAGQSKGKAVGSSQALDPHDLSGVVWGIQADGEMKRDYDPVTHEPPMTPWAKARWKTARSPLTHPAAIGEDDNDPVLRCEPVGVPRIYNGFGHPIQFVMGPDMITILYETDRIYRNVYMKRDHPKDSEALWFGDSTGRWDGNTLVVDTIDFNDRTWLDREGHPHSEKLHLIERYTRLDHDHLHLEITVDDPIAYTKPWGDVKDFNAEKGWELEEYMCSPSDEQKVIHQVMVPEAVPARKK